MYLNGQKSIKKCQNSTKKTLSTLFDTPLGVATFWKLLIFTIRNFLSTCDDPPPSPDAYPNSRTPPPPHIHKMWIICRVLFNPSLTSFPKVHNKHIKMVIFFTFCSHMDTCLGKKFYLKKYHEIPIFLLIIVRRRQKTFYIFCEIFLKRHHYYSRFL